MANISTAEGCKELVEEAQKHGQIDGIFNLAVCLRDGILENQTAQTFKECAAPKSVATIYLDEITRQNNINLKYFVVFSSVSCGRGNAGQTNYGLANSVMERIIEKRVVDGLSGKAIQWGTIGEVGIVAAMTENKIEAEIAGTVMQRISSCINEMDLLLTTSDPIVASMVVAKKHDLSVSGKKASLIEMVLNIMSIQSTNSISMNTSLADLGVDSLMTIEIKQALEREFDISISTKDLRATTFQTLQTLSDRGVDSMSLVPKSIGDLKELFNIKHMGMYETDDKPEPIYRLISKASANSIDELVLILPGIEGDGNPGWRLIGKNLNVTTLIGKYKATLSNSTIFELADIYAKVSCRFTNLFDIHFFIFQFYLETIPKNKKFMVIGYSFGTLVAIEVVRILEKSGLCGHLVCIDGSPAFLKRLIMKSINANHFSLKQMEKIILSSIAASCLPISNLDFYESRLDLLDEWDTKVQALIDLLAASRYEVNEKLLREFTAAIYNRTKSTYFYSTIERIQSDITLIRAKEEVVSDIDEMYELNSVTEGTVRLKYVEGSHFSILDSSELTNIINQLLSES